MLGMQDDLVRIAEGWNSIFVGEIAETRVLLEKALIQFPCYALTNTNVTHHATWATQFPAIASLFEHTFTSYEAGHRKPELAIFEHVSRSLGVPSDAIMFFDDCVENVESASNAGLHAVCVCSPEDVRNALQSIGCVF